MGYASRSGRAQTSASNPRAFAVCDRCGIWYNLDQLQWQYEWNATTLYNKRLLFCRSCLDDPQEQLRTIVLPPDPLPVLNARTENFTADETGPVQSSISVNAARGATVISVASVTGFTIGNPLSITLDNGMFFQTTVSVVGSTTLTIPAPLLYPSSIGQLVTVIF